MNSGLLPSTPEKKFSQFFQLPQVQSLCFSKKFFISMSLDLLLTHDKVLIFLKCPVGIT